MATNGLYQLERIQYWQGQMLRAGDLRAQQAKDEQLRWWHNRGLHDIYGVRFGLTVTNVAGAPVPTLEVACGIAYDCFGHEIVLPAPRQVPIPVPPANDQRARILLIRYRTNGNARACCEGAVEPCWPASGSQLPGNIELAWKVESQLPTSDGVPLARVTFSSNGPQVDSFRPPIARPLARARLASGGTIPGNTPWEVWHEDFTDSQGTVQQIALGMQTRIDTSAAGFTGMPCYFAQLMGPLWDRASGVFVPAFFPNIADATTTAFTFRLLMRGIPRQVFQVRIQEAASINVVPGRPAYQMVDLVEKTALRPGDQVAILGKGELAFASVAHLDRANELAALDFGALNRPHGLAMGTQLSTMILFNPSFGAFFTAFARRQKLYVSWLGCQTPGEPPVECPGARPVPSPCSETRN